MTNLPIGKQSSTYTNHHFLNIISGILYRSPVEKSEMDPYMVVTVMGFPSTNSTNMALILNVFFR